MNTDKLNRVLSAQMEEDANKGLLLHGHVIVKQHGETVFEKCRGLKCLGGEPLAKNAIYRIASMTKPVTAVAVLQMWEKGKIDLDAPVSEYFPAYDNMMLGHVDGETIVFDGPSPVKLRVRHLLCHTNGMDVLPMYDLLIRNHPRKKLQDTVDYYATCPLSFVPTRATGYSESAGFDVAARIVEMVSGEEYGSYLNKHIFAPLGMADTGFAPTKEQEERLVSIHNCREDGTIYEDASTPGCIYEDIPYSCCLGGGGLFSTAYDYMRFAEMLQNGGENILSEKALRMMTTPQVSEEIMPGSERWGFGVRVITDLVNPFGLPQGTFGWSGAYGTHFFVDRKNGITALYMRNTNDRLYGGWNVLRVFEKNVYACME